MKKQFNWKEIRKSLRAKFPNVCIYNDKRKAHRRIKITTQGKIEQQKEIAGYLIVTYPGLAVHHANGSLAYNGFFNGVCIRLPL